MSFRLPTGPIREHLNILDRLRQEEYNPHLFDSVVYEKIAVSPEENLYTQIKSNYYMPKVDG